MKITGTDYVKYVAVEIIANNSESVKDVECGLFIGISKRSEANSKESTFVVIAMTDSVIKIFNMEYYGIITIEVIQDMTRFTTIFQNTYSDQLKASATLDYITNSMKEEGRVLKNDLKGELIDIDTYSEFDAWIVAAGGNINGYGKGRVNDSNKYLPAVQKKVVEKVKKKPELFFIEKKEVLIDKLKLSNMTKIVKKLNTFSPPIPICLADIHDEIAGKKNVEDVLNKTNEVDYYNTDELY